MKYLVLITLMLYPAANCLSQVHLGPGQPFATIQAAVNANAVQPGDTVYLHAGSYAGYQAITNLKGNDNEA